MILEPVLAFSHSILEKRVQPGDIVVDATVGNGHDTLFLAKLVGPAGKVYGFDIQEIAIRRTKERLEKERAGQNVVLFHCGHEELLHRIPEKDHGKISGAIFNLGYLPKGDHTIITKPETTLKAVEGLLQITAPGGVISIVVYEGHPGGKAEKEALLDYVQKIDQTRARVLMYRFINQKNDPPFCLAIEKTDPAPDR
ncbi:class I SAM-dependent methyltransferase [Caldibacillus debilis]|uniref:class I SAM-dependent methyltransferase n=1 Tax=Caldibacillus debilis TaxID=301148 RepID=UPI00077980D5|nr:class I SAM-dependent methyltransferase [Caldibacillus debilis]